MATCSITYDDLMNPVMKALRLLGGSGTNEEIYDKVVEIAKIPVAELEIPHGDNDNGMTEIEYRLMWTRTYLKNYGLIDNSTRGVWSFTEKGQKTTEVDQKEVVRYVKGLHNKKTGGTKETGPEATDWQEELLKVILKISPPAFERLIQRVLREAGFIQVEVTGRSGDGGIDGHGIMRLGDMLGFQVIFQAKRWKGSVGPSQVRDFRGAMVGRADKGLLITTGTFSREAKKEATRDGAPAIDLIEGDQFSEMLKRLSLGVSTKMVEQVEIDKEWFQKI
jgi:restriction system protein